MATSSPSVPCTTASCGCWSPPLPSIAAINGAAVGAGFNLAFACDVRLAAESARFDTRFAALRLHPGGGHTLLLTRAVGAQQAAWWRACSVRSGTRRPRLHAAWWQLSTARAAEVLSAALAIANTLDAQDPDFVRRLTATLRRAAGGSSHGEMLALETSAQEWSLRQPPFLTGLSEIRSRVGKPS